MSPQNALGMRSSLFRFSISAVVVLVASSLYFIQGAVRSAAAAPWLWAFLLGERFTVREMLPISPAVWFLATALLLAIGARRRVSCFVVTGWCVLNAVVASVMNFQLYGI